MIKKIIIGLLACLLSAALYFSRGPAVRIETPAPAQDFVVLCIWASPVANIIHGGRKVVRETPMVMSSGETESCGLSLIGALTLSASSARVMHPVYWDVEVIQDGNLKLFRYTKTKLDTLDELKAKFETGFWGNYPDPGVAYLKSLPGCGFPYQYLDYYSEVKKIDLNHFKHAYNNAILDCHKRRYPILEKYDPYTLKKIPQLDERMELLWSDKRWINK